MGALLDHAKRRGVPPGQRYLVRGDAPAKSLPIEGVLYLGEGISDKDYWHLMREADVVVIPYPSPGFKYRTSGIVVDALVSATPTIVLEDTWLADVVKRARAGLVVKYQSPLTIVSAISVVLAHQKEIQKGMATGAIEYLSENSWSATANMAMM